MFHFRSRSIRRLVVTKSNLHVLKPPLFFEVLNVVDDFLGNIRIEQIQTSLGLVLRYQCLFTLLVNFAQLANL